MDRKRRRITNFIITVVVLAVCGGVIAISFYVRTQVEDNIANSVNPAGDSSDIINSPTTSENNPPDSSEIVEAKFINLQPTLDEWVSEIVHSSKSVGVMIYDLNNSRVAAEHNADQVFDVASVYKLLFAYDGYRQIAIGKENGTSHIVTTKDKGDLDLSQCLDLIIRESYNGCADVLNKDKTRIARVNNIIRENEMSNTTNIGLESTAADLTKLLRTYWRHADLTNQLWKQLSNSMLVQPVFTNPDGQLTDLRQGLPAGFSKSVNVYNKVGWEWNPEQNHWNIYADAAIVDFTLFQHSYTIVVLTKNIENANIITQLGKMIEDEVTIQSEGIIK